MPELEIMIVQINQLTSSKIKTFPASGKIKMQANTVNKEQVADLVLNKGITQEQAANLAGCTQGRISQIIKEYSNNPDYIEIGRAHV